MTFILERKEMIKLTKIVIEKQESLKVTWSDGKNRFIPSKIFKR